MDFLAEFLGFLKERKKLWLTPVIALMILLGGLVIVAKTSVLAALLYTLF